MPSQFRRNEQLMLILTMLLEQSYSALWLLQSFIITLEPETLGVTPMKLNSLIFKYKGARSQR